MKKILFLLLLFNLSFGCARAVTDKTVNLTFALKINFRGNIDTSKYRYGIVLSTSGTPQFPSIGTQDYFPTPGSHYDPSNTYLLTHSTGITYYYQSFYDTWSDYVVSVGNTFNLYQSNSTAFSATTTQNAIYVPVSRVNIQHNLGAVTSQIQIVIPLQYLSSSGPLLYFGVYTTSITDSPVIDGTESGLILDQLRSTDPNLQMKAGAPTNTVFDQTNSDIPAAADIISWEAVIY